MNDQLKTRRAVLAFTAQRGEKAPAGAAQSTLPKIPGKGGVQ